MNWLGWLRPDTPIAPPARQDMTWRSDSRPLTLRPWHDDPGLTGEQKRIIKALLAAPRQDQRDAYKLLLDRKQARKRRTRCQTA